MSRSASWVTIWLLAGARLGEEGAPEKKPELPPPAGRAVSFAQDIHPLLRLRCFKCHGDGARKGDFQIDSRDLVLRGGKTGPAVVPGKSGESYLIELVAGLHKDKVMPKQGPRLTGEEIGLLRAWIDQGLAWEDVKAGRTRKPRELDLRPRRPQVPGPTASGENPVDLFLAPYFAEHGARVSAPVDDRVYARRAYLDTIGLLPPPRELEEFLEDRRPEKREELARRLLSRSRAYAEHWISFWNDLLRNDYRGTGYIDGGRRQITAWLYAALARNLPYDRMVTELVNPGEESSGFIKGIVWRGVTNASQTAAMQAAQTSSQVFLGINLKCASCHDSFVSDWTLREAYGLASVFSEEPLELVRCDAPQGEIAVSRFLYPELGEFDPAKPVPERRARLASMLTRKENGRLARTMVNRLWARFLGRGLIEPLDEMDNPAWHPDLLDWLASDLAEHGYDLKHAMLRILTSRAYQMPSVSRDEKDQAPFVFRGPISRRMPAEALLDAVASLTGIGQPWPEAPVNFTCLAESPDPDLDRPPDAPAAAVRVFADAPGAESEAIYLYRTVNLKVKPAEACVVAYASGRFSLHLNGQKLVSRDDARPVLLNLLPHLAAGENTLAVEAARPSEARAEVFVYVRARAPGEVMDFGTGASWKWAPASFPGFRPAAWKAVTALDPAPLLREAGRPGTVERRIAVLLGVGSDGGRFRASLVSADPLMIALGRPNREQVISKRQSVATTLEGLELTNGPTLAGWLKRGAERLCSAPSAPNLAEELYLRALGRRPSPEEAAIARGVLGDPLRHEGVEDLLWCLIMLPEFQVIE